MEPTARYQSLSLSLRRVVLIADWRRAFEGWVSRRPAGSAAVLHRPEAEGVTDNVQSEGVQTSRIWVQGPSRWRHEVDVPGRGVAVTVVDGTLWWSYVPGVHALSNVSNPGTYLPLPDDHPAWELLHPGELIRHMLVTDTVSDRHLGRQVDVVRAVPDGEPHPRLPRGQASMSSLSIEIRASRFA